MSDTVFTITDKVLTHLRTRILNGTIAPGERIDQAEVSRQFGVSLVPVREALARLQSSGLVHIVPHRGVFVEPISLSEMIDIYYMREVLEEQAAQLAVKNMTAETCVQVFLSTWIARFGVPVQVTSDRDTLSPSGQWHNREGPQADKRGPQSTRGQS